MTVHFYVLSVFLLLPVYRVILGSLIFFSLLFSFLYRFYFRSVDFESQISDIHAEVALKSQETFEYGTKNV